MSELKEKLLFLTAAIRGTDTEDIVEALIDDVVALREAFRTIYEDETLEEMLERQKRTYLESDARLKRILGE
jgi:hypothetical protein